jgi:magnesium-transporting ATPase (P-type)
MSKKVLKNKEKKESADNFFKFDLFKKILIALFLVFLLFFIFRGITGNAVYSDFGYQLDRAIYQIQPFIQFFLGAEDYSGQLLFERFLFFLVILSIVSVVLKGTDLFKDQKKIVMLLSVIISILSVRYISFEWIKTTAMSYAVLGIALMSFLPFLIYFFFLKGFAPNSSGLRKIGWILFACIYFGLSLTAENNYYGKVYLWTGLASLAFLFLDGTINRYMTMEKLRVSGSNNTEEAVIKIRRKMAELKDDLTKGIIDNNYYNKHMKQLNDNLRVVLKHSF